MKVGLLALILFSHAVFAADSCYESCDTIYSSCYTECARHGECRQRCSKDRLVCLDDCVPPPSALEKEVVALTNAERAKLGLSKLTWNVRLGRAARNHATNMARHERMEHALNGEGPGDRIERVGYEGAWAENVARGWGSSGASAEAIVDWWMSSPSHRANIANSELNEIGVGVVKGRDGKSYFCQNFGGRKKLFSSTGVSSSSQN